VPTGTAGSTTYSYAIQAIDGLGNTTTCSSVVTTTTGNATLSTTNYNNITWNPVLAPGGYYVRRTAGGATQGIIATVAENTWTAFNASALGLTWAGPTQTIPNFYDSGFTGDGSSCPGSNTTGVIEAGSLVGASHVAVNPSNGALIASTPSAPQVSVLTATSGTYSTPAGALYLLVQGCGPAGGGGGSGTGSPGNGGNGAASTTFGTLTAPAGGGGPAGSGSSQQIGGAAGAIATGGDINFGGNPGAPGLSLSAGAISGGVGGASYFGGAGQGGTVAGSAGSAATANSCSGGGGASSSLTIGSGGGGGAFFQKLIASPASTYSYAVPAGGAGGTAGGSGFAGGAGAAGLIIVTAYFQ
jgi:hypothetical protein